MLPKQNDFVIINQRWQRRRKWMQMLKFDAIGRIVGDVCVGIRVRRHMIIVAGQNLFNVTILQAGFGMVVIRTGGGKFTFAAIVEALGTPDFDHGADTLFQIA